MVEIKKMVRVNLVEPDKVRMRAGVHHSDLSEKHLQHQRWFATVRMITGEKRKVAQVGDHQKYSLEILQPAVSVFVANNCIFRQPYVWWVCVKSGDSAATTAADELWRWNGLFHPNPSSQCSIHESEFALRPFQLWWPSLNCSWLPTTSLSLSAGYFSIWKSSEYPQEHEELLKVWTANI